MDKFDRFQLLHRTFRSHKNPIPLARLAERLECSEKTVKRAIANMCDYLDAPVKYYPEQNGWQYDEDETDLYELPGLWLTSSELQSLALLMQLLENLGEGLLADELGVVEKHIGKLLQARGILLSEFDQHIKILPLNNSYIPNSIYATVCEALLTGKRLEIKYSSYHQASSHRIISPQTLIYYRENWYLDAWCHLRNELRTFSLSRITSIANNPKTSTKIAADQLKQHFANSYGIFSGQSKYTAKLRFAPAIAREIALQQWHPQQQAEWDGDDYLLTIPYSDDRELLQDLLRYTPNVYVVAPVKLRKKLQAKLQQGLELQLGKGLGWL